VFLQTAKRIAPAFSPFALPIALSILLIVATVRAGEDRWFSFVQWVPVTIEKETIQLQMRIYHPSVDGKLPTLLLNHGSTGSGMDADRFKKPVDMPTVATFFVKRGWVVVVPARRGRSGSEGLYDEGFSIIRSLGYTCFPSRSLAGADRALQDIEAAMRTTVDMPFVDPNRVAIGGVSRGGALSIAYAGKHPHQVKAVINFVGGWLGWPCPTMNVVNQSLFNRGAAYPGKTIWLYAENDTYYSMTHSRKNFSAFIAAGGKGDFYEYDIPAKNGHWLPRFPNAWSKDLESYLKQVGLPSSELGAERAHGIKPINGSNDQ
jgi:dienelactone hydrolase